MRQGPVAASVAALAYLPRLELAESVAAAAVGSCCVLEVVAAEEVQLVEEPSASA